MSEKTQLTKAEYGELALLEGVIEKGLGVFYEVGAALLKIRDSRLYRESHSTFEEYCRERWKFKKSQAYRLIEAAEIREDLSPMGDALPTNERQARPLASVPREERAEVWEEAVETAPDGVVTAKHVQETVQKRNGAHVSHNSGENEWYTPESIIKAARRVMGGIDLDPASCESANEVVQADSYYTAEDDGLAQEWEGRVWMNPPYSQPLIGKFAEKLAESVESESVTAACVLVNNATETKWFQTLLRVSDAVCFPAGRIRFWHPERDKATPLQGQAILYLGYDADKFINRFEEFGLCLYRAAES